MLRALNDYCSNNKIRREERKYRFKGFFLNLMEAYSISEAFLGFRWLSEGCYHLENYFANNMYYSVESFGIIMAGELRYRIKI